MSTKLELKGVGDYDKAILYLHPWPFSAGFAAGVNYERKFNMTGMGTDPVAWVREGR